MIDYKTSAKTSDFETDDRKNHRRKALLVLYQSIALYRIVSLEERSLHYLLVIILNL